MSIEQHKENEPDAPPQGQHDHRLTATNLAMHEQNTATVSTNRAVRSWLNGSGTSPQVLVDDETWARLVERDPVAAAIDDAIRGGVQSREQQK